LLIRFNAAGSSSEDATPGQGRGFLSAAPYFQGVRREVGESVKENQQATGGEGRDVVPDLFMVIRRYGPPYAPGRPLEEQQDWEAHRAFMNALEAERLVRLGGPLEEREDVLLIFHANDKEEIERRLADDPWTRSGLLSTIRISRWELRIGKLA
jgi:uncharacterized protein YciI